MLFPSARSVPSFGWIAAARAFLLGAVFSVDTGRAEAATTTRSHASDAATAAGFQRLVLPHLDAAYSLARYLTRDATASEDIVQDAYLKAFRGFSTFRGGDARAWILAIVRNATRDWQSRQRTERHYVATPAAQTDDDTLSTDAIEMIAAEIESAESVLVRDGEDQRVRAAIELIPDRLREVLILREMEDSILSRDPRRHTIADRDSHVATGAGT